MKTSLAWCAAIAVHAALIGLLMGMSLSPIVGVILPLLLGVGGYRLFDVLTVRPAVETEHSVVDLPGIAWLAALWCVIVIVSLFTGIGLRNGSIRLGGEPVTTLSRLDFAPQPIDRIPDLALIGSYYDRLDLTPSQRVAVASALSDTTLATAPILTSLQLFFAGAGAAKPAQEARYGVFEFHRTTP